jgi:predicted transcriptional regulator
MEISLLDLILLSEKRKNVLLLLLEEPKDIETIKKTLNASATSVQPQVKKLKEQHLIVQEKDLYKLRNDETIISSISVTDIVFDVYLKKWNYKVIPKVKTWSYFLTIPKQFPF